MQRCWVIPNGAGKPWRIDEDETKPVYIKHGMPVYKPGELFNYHLSNTPPEGYCEELEKTATGYQFTLEDFIQDAREDKKQTDFSCFESWKTGINGIGTNWECTKEESCQECEAFQQFYEKVDKYRERGWRLAVAHEAAKKELGIKSAYYDDLTEEEKEGIKNAIK